MNVKYGALIFWIFIPLLAILELYKYENINQLIATIIGSAVLFFLGYVWWRDEPKKFNNISSKERLTE